MMHQNRLIFAGMVAPIWLVCGVVAAGLMYPGYNHLTQAMSELGATGAPTEIISPIINNYPVGILFILFGIAIYRAFPQSGVSKLSAVLIALHGCASIGTGYFSCDIACQPEAPSIRHNLHMTFGMIMFLSLLLAAALWLPLSAKLLESRIGFWCSALSVVIGILSLAAMASSAETASLFGLYQRVNYGAALFWVFALSVLVSRSASVRS